MTVGRRPSRSPPLSRTQSTTSPCPRAPGRWWMCLTPDLEQVRFPTHSDTHAHTQTHTCVHTHTLRHARTHTDTHVCTHTHSLRVTDTHTPSTCHTHTHTLC